MDCKFFGDTWRNSAQCMQRDRGQVVNKGYIIGCVLPDQACDSFSSEFRGHLCIKPVFTLMLLGLFADSRVRPKDKAIQRQPGWGNESARRSKANRAQGENVSETRQVAGGSAFITIFSESDACEEFFVNLNIYILKCPQPNAHFQKAFNSERLSCNCRVWNNCFETSQGQSKGSFFGSSSYCQEIAESKVCFPTVYFGIMIWFKLQ